MARIAKISGGEAYTAKRAGELRQGYKDIGSSVGEERE
jgi:Ca-activated chloride channel homolog